MKNKVLTVLCAALAVTLVVVILFFVLPKKDNNINQPAETTETDRSQKLDIDPNIGEEEPKPTPVEQGIAIPGWGSITLPAGETEAAVNLENPAANKDAYYLTFELCLKKTDEVLFTTGLVPPGESCSKVALTRKLEAGEYEAVIHVQPYKMDENQTPTNNADMETMLVVK